MAFARQAGIAASCPHGSIVGENARRHHHRAPGNQRGRIVGQAATACRPGSSFCQKVVRAACRLCSYLGTLRERGNADDLCRGDVEQPRGRGREDQGHRRHMGEGDVRITRLAGDIVNRAQVEPAFRVADGRAEELDAVVDTRKAVRLSRDLQRVGCRARDAIDRRRSRKSLGPGPGAGSMLFVDLVVAQLNAFPAILLSRRSPGRFICREQQRSSRFRR